MTTVKSPATLAALLATLLLVVTFAAAPALPMWSFFALPSLYYIVAALLCVLMLTRSRTPSSDTVLSIWIAALFVLLGQVLILAQGVPTRWLAWGRFPLGDAADFLSNAVILSQDGEFVSIRGRPLSNAYIAGLFRLTGFDTALVGSVTVALGALSLFFFTRIAIPILGVAATCLAAAISADFLHEHLGSASTEPLGYFLGMAACAVLLVAARNRSLTLFLFGIATLTLAFLTRAGGLFVLPALLLLPFFLGLGWRRSLAWGGGGLVAIAIVFSAHLGAVRIFTPDSPGFVNAPKSWYAIIAMGDEARGLRPAGSVRLEARWLQIFDDHPGLNTLPIEAQGSRFMEIVTTAALDRPLSMIVGSALEFKDQLGRAGLFRFIDNKPIRAAIFLLFVIGFCFAALRARHDPVAALLLLSGLGQILSIPFLHGGENRVHIVSSGFMALTAAYVIVVVRDRLTVPVKRPVGNIAYGPLLLPIIALAFAALPLYGSPAGLADARHTDRKGDQKTDPVCAGTSVPALTAISAGSVVSAGMTSPGVLALSFDTVQDWKSSQQRWLSTARWDNLFFYAPITPGAVPLPEPMPNGAGGLAYAIRLTADNSGAEVAAQVVRIENSAQVEPARKMRCFP